MNILVSDHIDAIRTLGREYGVVRLEVFGSVCTDEFDPEQSDVDILVEFPADYDFGPWHAKFHALQRSLTALLGHPVDLVDVWALRNPWFAEEAGMTRRVIYDAASLVQTAS